MNRTKKIRHHCFTKQLAFGVFFLRYFGNEEKCKRLTEELSQFPNGTVGRTLYQKMKNQNITFVPYYESHDLKHVLLGYDMEAGQEMQMQAFMFGNSGFSLWYTLITLSFLIWTPEVWSSLPYHYRVGKHCASIANWTVEQVAAKNLQELRHEIGLYDARLLAYPNGQTRRNFFYNYTLYYKVLLKNIKLNYKNEKRILDRHIGATHCFYLLYHLLERENGLEQLDLCGTNDSKSKRTL